MWLLAFKYRAKNSIVEGFTQMESSELGDVVSKFSGIVSAGASIAKKHKVQQVVMRRWKLSNGMQVITNGNKGAIRWA